MIARSNSCIHFLYNLPPPPLFPSKERFLPFLSQIVPFFRTDQACEYKSESTITRQPSEPQVHCPPFMHPHTIKIVKHPLHCASTPLVLMHALLITFISLAMVMGLPVLG